ncbi:MAG: hypothetical protein AAF937_11145 [Planctomycetota bacterium]
MRRWIAAILPLLPAAACVAQSDDPQPAPTEAVEARPDTAEPPRRYGFFSGTYERAPRPIWLAEVEANAWYASPGGDISIGNTEPTGTAGFNLDSPRATAMVEAHLRSDPWTFTVRGSLLDVGARTTLTEPVTLGPATFAAGDSVSSGYRLDEIVFRAGYKVYQFDADANARGRPLLSAGLDLMGGVRLYDGTFGVEGPVSSAGASFTHVEPLIGFTADITFADRYEIQLQNSYGATPTIDDQRSFTFDIQATFKYRFVDNAAFQLGYRLRRTVLEGSDFELDGAVAGVFAGLTVRF